MKNPVENPEISNGIQKLLKSSFDGGDLEWSADYFRDIAAACELIADTIEESPEYSDPEPEELHARFVAEILPMVQEQYEQNGKPDLVARREAFNNWTDALCKGGKISGTLYESIDHPAECGEAAA